MKLTSKCYAQLATAKSKAGTALQVPCDLVGISDGRIRLVIKRDMTEDSPDFWKLRVKHFGNLNKNLGCSVSYAPCGRRFGLAERNALYAEIRLADLTVCDILPENPNF